MTQTHTLQWPGLWDLPTCVVDHETNRVYDCNHPLPPQKTHLDSVRNRCVRLSSVLSLFAEDLRDEAEWTLRRLLDCYDVGKPIHSTKTMSTKSGEKERKVTTYIPSVTLMAFAFVWPYCQGFQVRHKPMFCKPTFHLARHKHDTTLSMWLARVFCLCRACRAARLDLFDTTSSTRSSCGGYE